jgi:cytochrome c553
MIPNPPARTWAGDDTPMITKTCLGLAAGVVLALPCVGQDGREVFLRNCATCHGQGGQGDGPTPVVPRPRDLTSGKFSFGTTPEAVEKTIRGGIAPAMPAFGDVLGDDEVQALVAYVRSLMPQTLEASPDESRVRLGRLPRLVRGQLPPRPGSSDALPRGLVIGLPHGFSLEYRTDDLRLLRTFTCPPGEAFVDRADWRGRGGQPLALLGEPLDPHDRGMFEGSARLAGLDVDLRLRLRASAIEGDTVHLSADLMDGTLRLGRWEEQVRSLELDGGRAIHRRIEIHDVDTTRSLRIATAGLRLLNVTRRERATLRGLELFLAGSPDGDALVEVLAVRGPRSMKTSLREGAGIALVPVGDRPFTRLDVIRARVPLFDPDRLDPLAEGFDR